MRLCGWPFSRTWYWTDDMHSIINLTQWVSNPILCRRASIKTHSTLLYAFLMSVLIAIYLSWQDLLVIKPWNIYWAIKILSDISLPATKADCVSEISFGRQLFNLSHKTFEIILYPKLHRVIGRNSVILVGISIFRIIQILVLLTLSLYLL